MKITDPDVQEKIKIARAGLRARWKELGSVVYIPPKTITDIELKAQFLKEHGQIVDIDTERGIAEMESSFTSEVVREAYATWSEQRSSQ